MFELSDHLRREKSLSIKTRNKKKHTSLLYENLNNVNIKETSNIHDYF